MTAAPQTIKLYHGTPRFFTGYPTRGQKDILGGGYLSMTPDRDIAEFFSGEGRDARVYAVDIPVDQFLDLRKESEKLGKKGDWKGLNRLIQNAERSGKYQAVVIHDITMGSDAPEVRLVQVPPPQAWTVQPSEGAFENYAKADAIIRRFNDGESVSRRDRNKARKLIEEDLKYSTRPVYDVMLELEQEGESGGFRSVQERRDMEQRIRNDETLVAALKANKPTSTGGLYPLFPDGYMAGSEAAPVTLASKPRVSKPKASKPKAAQAKAVATKMAAVKPKSVNFKQGKNMANCPGKHDVPDAETVGRSRRCPCGPDKQGKTRGGRRKVNITMS